MMLAGGIWIARIARRGQLLREPAADEPVAQT